MRIDHDEELIESLQMFLEKKKIESCTALFLGAIRDGRAVTGPKRPEIPPQPNFEAYESAWEVFGMATFYPSAQGHRLHIHSALGRGKQALIGCIREKARVYLLVEMVLFEICSIEAERIWDEEMQLFLLKLKDSL